MTNILKHKHALKEIFEAKMVSGQSLYEKCDAVLSSAVTGLPGEVSNFITLGDFIIDDVPVGDLRDKFMQVVQEIICGSAVDDREDDTELEVEYRAYELARLVRTILKNNRTLTSATYTTGVAKETHILDSPLEHVIYGSSRCAIMRITLMIKMTEDD